MSHSVFSGFGHYLPKKQLSNCDLSKKLDTSDAWIRKRTGIASRHIASDDEKTSTLAANALSGACVDANILPESIGALIVATSTPDMTFPSTASIVAHNVGCHSALTMDINAACSGFVTALIVADSMLQTKVATRIAVVGADLMSSVVNWEDRSTCVLFGDGAGAVILEKREHSSQIGIIDSNLQSNCEQYNMLTANRAPLTKEGSLHTEIKMQGAEVFKYAVQKMSNVATSLLSKNGLTLAQLELLVPHQANQRIMHAVAKSLDIDQSKTVSVIENCANTCAATIPIALSMHRSRVLESKLSAIVTAGAGLTYGGLLIGSC